MSARIKSMELMKSLRPFTQLGLLSASSAQILVTEYTKNNKKPLESFVFSPDIPITYTSLLQEISRNFLN